MDAQHIELYIKGFIYIFPRLPISVRIGLVSGCLGMLNLYYYIFIGPIVFEHFVARGIEKKIGRKLEYSYIVNYFPSTRWGYRQQELAIYILSRYFAWKFHGDRGLPYAQASFALKKIGYTIDMMSKKEIFIAFTWLINVSTLLISMIVLFIAFYFSPVKLS